MPTVTSLWARSLINLGPLTTTFTAPASCSATPVPIGLADSALPMSGAVAMETCGRAPRGACLPSGADLDRDYTSSLSASGAAYRPIHFHSPGHACPADWATVGSVVKDADGAFATNAWDFDPYAVDDFAPPHRGDGGQVRLVDQEVWDALVFAHALGPEETGIACCPSGFTPFASGGCYSTAPIESYTATTACQAQPWYDLSAYDPSGSIHTYSTATLDVFEESVTIAFISMPLSGSPTITGLYPASTKTNTVTFSDPERIPFEDPQGGWLFGPPYVAYYTTDMVLLATGAASTGTAGGGGGDDADEDGDGGSGGTDDGDDGSAAVHGREGITGKIATVMGAWLAAMVVGGALIVPL